jgi:hypothetical protein
MNDIVRCVILVLTKKQWSLGLAALFILPTTCFAQTVGRNIPVAPISQATAHPVLTLVNTVAVPSQMATSFFRHARCDGDGNVYLKLDALGESGIRKFSPSGQPVALFRTNAVPDLTVQHAGYFFVTLGGELYQVVFVPNSLKRYIVVFDKEGNYKSTIKLDTRYSFMVSQLAVFQSGELLVSGLQSDSSSPVGVPLTAIYSSTGALLREVKLGGDAKLHDLAAKGDGRVVAAEHPSNNSAIELGTAEPAPDGNIYLMRRFSPALVYAISAGGAVVHDFQVDPGDLRYLPIHMHVSGNTIAILFRNDLTKQGLMKLVDLEGHEIATYAISDDKTDRPLGPAFACYMPRPDRFTFLTTMENGSLGFKIAEPR